MNEDEKRDVAEGLLRYIKTKEEDRDLVGGERLPMLIAFADDQLAVVRDALCEYWISHGGKV